MNGMDEIRENMDQVKEALDKIGPVLAGKSYPVVAYILGNLIGQIEDCDDSQEMAARVYEVAAAIHAQKYHMDDIAEGLKLFDMEVVEDEETPTIN